MICKECGSLFEPPSSAVKGLEDYDVNSYCVECVTDLVFEDLDRALSNRLWEENPEALRELNRRIEEEEEDNP